jgi:hypothetical protein
MIKRIKRVFQVLLLCTLFVSAYVAWSGITGRDLPWPIAGAVGGGSHVIGTDSHFDALRVAKGDLGYFDGTISIENPTDAFQDVLVTVALFDGEQNVGKLIGSVTLKPGSSSSVDLISFDPYAAWGDARVDLRRSPG